MDLLTVIFSDENYEKMMQAYEWTKNYSTNIKVIWNIEKLDQEEINKLEPEKAESIMPMKIKDWYNQPKYESYFLGWFKNEKSKYFCAITSKTMIVDKDFENKVIDFMEKQKIFAMFPSLHSQWTDKNHPLAQQMQGLMSKQWTMPGMTITHNITLQYYGQSFVHFPDYFHWLRYPTILANAGFHITSNPFIDTDKSFILPPMDNEENESWKLEDEVIKESIKEGASALFPIEDFNRVEKLIKEVNSEKKKT